MGMSSQVMLLDQLRRVLVRWSEVSLALIHCYVRRQQGRGQSSRNRSMVIGMSAEITTHVRIKFIDCGFRLVCLHSTPNSTPSLFSTIFLSVALDTPPDSF
jgi:hypothetical protein